MNSALLRQAFQILYCLFRYLWYLTKYMAYLLLFYIHLQYKNALLRIKMKIKFKRTWQSLSNKIFLSQHAADLAVRKGRPAAITGKRPWEKKYRHAHWQICPTGAGQKFQALNAPAMFAPTSRPWGLRRIQRLRFWIAPAAARSSGWEAATWFLMTKPPAVSPVPLNRQMRKNGKECAAALCALPKSIWARARPRRIYMEQKIIVAIIVVAALAYMLLRLRKNSKGKGCSCGCDCGCSGNKHSGCGIK